jgi:hypothetical protein
MDLTPQAALDAANDREQRDWNEAERRLLQAAIVPQIGDRAVDLLVRSAWRGGDYEFVARQGLDRMEHFWLEMGPDHREDITVIRHADVAAWRYGAGNPRVVALRAHRATSPVVHKLCPGSGHELMPEVYGPMHRPEGSAQHLSFCGACELDVPVEYQFVDDDAEREVPVLVTHSDAGLPL